MNGNQSWETEKLTKAISDAWSREASQVAKFGLQPIASGIKPAASGWTIPVVSGVLTGSAYELARVMDRLQEIIETQTNLSVTLFLDPFTGKSTPIPNS